MINRTTTTNTLGSNVAIKKGTLNRATVHPAPAKGLPETATGQRPSRDAASDACFLEYKGLEKQAQVGGFG